MNFKRLSLLGGHVARVVANMIELTPARLDLVVALFAGPRCQRDLAAQLCVHESVVSRLVHALMKLGFVRREIPNGDRRFRVVSLTTHGRQQYLRLTHAQHLLEPAGRFDCQSHGEAAWLSFWHRQLDGMGIAFLMELVRSDDPDEAPHVEPPYEAIRLHHRRGGLSDPYGCEYAPATACAARLPRPPNVRRGCSVDPRSVRALGAFEDERKAAAAEREASHAALLAAWRNR